MPSIRQALAVSLLQNVGPKLGGIGLGIMRREIRRIVDRLPDLGVDLLQLVLGEAVIAEQARAALLDRIALSAHLLHLVLRPVLGRIGHGMAPEAIGHYLEDVGPLARAGVLDRLAAGIE